MAGMLRSTNSDIVNIVYFWVDRQDDVLLP